MNRDGAPNGALADGPPSRCSTVSERQLPTRTCEAEALALKRAQSPYALPVCRTILGLYGALLARQQRAF
eukprot:3579742-Pleurochrysis_carterae.AAC.11